MPFEEATGVGSCSPDFADLLNAHSAAIEALGGGDDTIEVGEEGGFAVVSEEDGLRFSANASEVDAVQVNIGYAAGPSDDVTKLNVRGAPAQSVDIVNVVLSDNSKVFNIESDGKIKMVNLPTVEPAGTGYLWNDGGTLKISS